MTSSAGQNRAIMLTPPGAGAIAVVRIVGPRVTSFLERHFSRATSVGRCVHGQLRDENVRVVDDPVVVRVAHDRADINLHGGPWVVQATLDLLAREGFTVVTGDAALNDPATFDSDDPIEAEMLAALPLARTEQAVARLLQQPGLWRAFLRSTTAREDIDAILNDRSLWWMLHPPRVAIIGAPNVGKSTLANQLFGQHRSITADRPGTTRDWVGEIANIDGLPVMLLDTPGIRETTDPIEREAIERAGGEIRSADLVVIVLDLTRWLDEQRELIDRYREALVVANKSDLASSWNPADVNAQAICAKSGAGVDRLRQAILGYFISSRLNQPCWWTPRQREQIESLKAPPEPSRRPE